MATLPQVYFSDYTVSRLFCKRSACTISIAEERRLHMEENRIGQFIVELRKEKKLTQKDLAAQLHITDKAVSKWERGLSCPDITLLTSVADILGVTTSELLNGQRSETLSKDIEETVDNALVYAEKSVKRKMVSFQNILTISFSMFL